MGGFLGRSFGVEINVEGSSAKYTVLDYGYELFSEETINLTPKKVEEFLGLLKKIKIFEWERQYKDPGVIDGTNWSVEIICKDKKYEFSGNNAYPDTWESFCEAVEKLIGKEFR